MQQEVSPLLTKSPELTLQTQCKLAKHIMCEYFDKIQVFNEDEKTYYKAVYTRTYDILADENLSFEDIHREFKEAEKTIQSKHFLKPIKYINQQYLNMRYDLAKRIVERARELHANNKNLTLKTDSQIISDLRLIQSIRQLLKDTDVMLKKEGGVSHDNLASITEGFYHFSDSVLKRKESAGKLYALNYFPRLICDIQTQTLSEYHFLCRNNLGIVSTNLFPYMEKRTTDKTIRDLIDFVGHDFYIHASTGFNDLSNPIMQNIQCLREHFLIHLPSNAAYNYVCKNFDYSTLNIKQNIAINALFEINHEKVNILKRFISFFKLIDAVRIHPKKKDQINSVHENISHMSALILMNIQKYLTHQGYAIQSIDPEFKCSVEYLSTSKTAEFSKAIDCWHDLLPEHLKGTLPF